MSDLHVKILQDAKVIVENGTCRHTCNAIKKVVNWYSRYHDPALIKAAQEIIDHIEEVIAPEHTFENWLYYNNIITATEWDRSILCDPKTPNKAKRLRLEWMDDLIKHYKNNC